MPIVGYYQRLGDDVALGDERNRLRLSDYVRLDLRANRTFDVRHGRLTLFVEVLNATGRRNQRALEQPFYDRSGIVPRSTENLLPDRPVGGTAHRVLIVCRRPLASQVDKLFTAADIPATGIWQR